MAGLKARTTTGKYDFFKQEAARYAAQEKRMQELEEIATLLLKHDDLEEFDPEVARRLKTLTRIPQK